MKYFLVEVLINKMLHLLFESMIYFKITYISPFLHETLIRPWRWPTSFIQVYQNIIIFFIAFAVSACSSSVDKTVGTDVEFYGALRNMMHKGDISAKYDLRNLKKTTHLYALGALENLKGEIMILDSTPFI